MSVVSPVSAFERLRAVGLEPRDKAHHRKLKRASVLVLLFHQDNQVFTLITKRSMNLRSHPGECCFPGGRQDETDGNDDVVTALREAQEEVGLTPETVTVLCRLPTVESINHLCVTPIVAKVKDTWMTENFMHKYSWKINLDEVDKALAFLSEFF